MSDKRTHARYRHALRRYERISSDIYAGIKTVQARAAKKPASKARLKVLLDFEEKLWNAVYESLDSI